MCGAIKYAVCSGVKGVFTAHGNTYEDLIQNPIFNNMIGLKLFERIIFLDNLVRGKINKIYEI